MNLPIPPRPDSGAGVPQPERLTIDGRPRSTWGWFEGVGVYLIAFLAAGFAQIPILLLLGETMVNGAIGQTEIFATIVGDIVMVGVLVFWLRRWHPEWRAAMVLPPAQRPVLARRVVRRDRGPDPGPGGLGDQRRRRRRVP